MNNYIKYTLTQYIKASDFSIVIDTDHTFLDVSLYDFGKNIKKYINDYLNQTIKCLYTLNADFYNSIGIKSNKELMLKFHNNEVLLELEIFFINNDTHDDSIYESPYAYFMYYVNTKRVAKYYPVDYNDSPCVSMDNKRFEFSDLDDSIKGYELGDYVEFYCENYIYKGYITVAPEKNAKYKSRIYEVSWYDENGEFNSYWVDDFPKIHYDDIIRVISHKNYDIVKQIVLDEKHGYTKEYIEQVKEILFK